MTVQEFLNLAEENRNKVVNEDQKNKWLKKTLNVCDYLGIEDKKRLVQHIILECSFYENGVLKINGIDKYICLTMRTIEAYTNIVISGDISNDYDLLCSTKWLKSIIDLFFSEYNEISMLLEMQCDFLLADNNIENQVGQLLYKLFEKIDIIADVLENKLNDLDLSNISLNGKNIAQLLKYMKTDN